MQFKKSAVLIVVLGVMLILTILALVAVNLMTQESRVAEHKIRRIQAYYAAQGGTVHAIERLRREGAATGTINNINGNPINVGGMRAQITVATAAAGSPSSYTVESEVDYSR